MIVAIFRRFMTFRRRNRVAVLLLAMTTFLVGAWMFVGRDGSWSAKYELRSPMAALPLAFSPDGSVFLTYGRDGITSWDVSSGQMGQTWALKSGQHPEMGAFAPDGKAYAAGVLAYPGPLSIDLFDTASGKARLSLKTSRELIAHLSFSPDGKTLVALLGDDPQTAACSSWNPAYAGDLSEAVTWDAVTGQQLSSLPITAPTRGGVIAISPDGRILAMNDRRSSSVELWDLGADKTLGSLANPATAAVIQAGMGFSDDGRTLAIGRTDGSIELWDVPSRRLLRSLRGQTDDFTHTLLRFSPESRTIAVTGYRWGQKTAMTRIRDEILRLLGQKPNLDAELLVLDVETGRRLAGAKNSSRPIYSPDGMTIATGEPDGSTSLHDAPKP